MNLNYYKLALQNLITRKVLVIVNEQYKNDPHWQCLKEPVCKWENRHFIYLSILLDLGTNTLKRIYTHKCYDRQTQTINRNTKKKIAAFLEIQDLESYIYQYLVSGAFTQVA